LPVPKITFIIIIKYYFIKRRAAVCGRYSLAVDAVMFAKYFNMVIEELDFYSRYNIAPGQPAPVIGIIEGKRAFYDMQWGLRPDWLREKQGSKILINARAETLCSKPTFRRSFEHRRCLIPADGYYEWKKNKGGKTPFRIILPDAPVFAFAGIWDFYTDNRGIKKPSFCIITVAASSQIQSIHQRMPAILPDARSMDRWMDTGSPAASLLDILKPYEGRMDAYPVSPAVNSPLCDSPECIKRITL